MKSKKITLILMIFYLIALIWVIIFKLEFSIKELPQIRNINLIPFNQPAIVNGKADISEIVLNVFAFIPYGLFIHILMDEKSILKKLFIIFATSFIFELIQYIFAIGASDITDIISNTSGGIIGVVVSMFMEKLLRENWIKCINIVSTVCAIILTAIIVILLLTNI
ncbi:VanZ-like protein [Peptoanaerobacter stomatis]|uniref:VanZ-like protein n=1 Tax=Peptoanaerobacter stomatis TaxID=796937 RepID=J6HC63_9FIRM|nr:VanZ family protein [Peptoanaerobacter stomatis]EJU20408.1 VanZ-like protein [Peptoanaerobacter stomatis]NWO25686.1 VanZ family protein [Peptostreptococcaceae bacterium oral taxon 081]